MATKQIDFDAVVKGGEPVVRLRTTNGNTIVCDRYLTKEEFDAEVAELEEEFAAVTEALKKAPVNAKAASKPLPPPEAPKPPKEETPAPKGKKAKAPK